MNTFLVWDPWATKYGVWIQEYHMGIEVTVMEVGQISLLSGPGVGVESHGVVPWTTYCFHVFHGLQHPQCLGAVRHGPILKDWSPHFLEESRPGEGRSLFTASWLALGGCSLTPSSNCVMITAQRTKSTLLRLGEVM